MGQYNRNDGIDIPKRKPNRLWDYDYGQNGAYFITICTQDRKRILSDIVGDGELSPTIGNIIGWYKYQVTKRYNERADTKGIRLFQRSYYDHVIRNQRDYDEIWQYIENNPIKWKLGLDDDF